MYFFYFSNARSTSVSDCLQSALSLTCHRVNWGLRIAPQSQGIDSYYVDCMCTYIIAATTLHDASARAVSDENINYIAVYRPYYA